LSSPLAFLLSALSKTGGGSRQWPASQQERSRTLLSSESQPEFTEEGGVGITFLLGAFNFLTVLRDPFFLNFVEVLEDEDWEAEGEEGPVWKALCGCGLPYRSQCSLSNLCNLFALDSFCWSSYGRSNVETKSSAYSMETALLWREEVRSSISSLPFSTLFSSTLGGVEGARSSSASESVPNTVWDCECCELLVAVVSVQRNSRPHVNRS